MKDRYDVVVAGAGAAGMTAAAVAAAEGLSVLLVEKSDRVGGTTAYSGGMVWIPANPKMAEAGLADTPEAGALYMRNTVPGDPSDPLRLAFLNRSPEALAYLERKTAVKLKPVVRYPDYYPEIAGSTEGGRVLEPVPFDLRELGPHIGALRDPLPEFTLLGGMMVARADIPHFRNFYRSLRSAARVGELVARYALQRLSLSRGATLYLGNALAARLLKSVLDLKVDLALSTAIDGLETSGGRVDGVRVIGPGGSRTIRATRGVVLAAGGFSHDHEMRRRFFPPAAGEHSAAFVGNTGDAARIASEAGAGIGATEVTGAFWVPVSVFSRPDGSKGIFPHTVTDRAKPGVIAVSPEGRRFVNEAKSYHEFVLAMFRTAPADAPAKAYLICDSSFIWRYGLGAVKPYALNLRRWLDSGYLVSAATIGELGAKLGLAPGRLEATIDSYNAGARLGTDPEFGRGENVYQRHLGDAAHQPNPCVAPIEKAPFYAVTLHPGDLGTSSGIVTDEHAQVLTPEGERIAGLYACGNDMRSVMNGAYPGPGITLAPALTFGYIAARHIASGSPEAG